MLYFISLGLYILEVIGFFIIGMLVFMRQKSPTFRRFAYLAFALGVWQGLQLLARLAYRQHDVAIMLLKTSIGMSGVMAAYFLIFSLTYVDRKVPVRRIVGAGIIAGLLALNSHTLNLVAISSNGIGIPKLDIWYGIVLAFGALAMLSGVVSIMLHYVTSHDANRKKQDRIILLSTAFSGIVIVFSSFYTSGYSNSIVAEHTVPFACLITVFGLLYAMRFYQLFDIRSFVLRAVAYAITTVLLALIYVGPALYLIGTVIMGFPLVWPKFFIGVLVGTVVAVNYDRLRKWFNSKTNNIFFRDDYDSALLLGELNKVLVATIDLNKLLTESADLIAASLKTEYCVFVLNETGGLAQQVLGTGGKLLNPKSIEALKVVPAKVGSTVVVLDELTPEEESIKKVMMHYDVAAVVRLEVGGSVRRDMGYILLGFKKSGNTYDVKDARTLETIADVLIIAIQNALRFKEIQEFNLTLQQKVYDATAQLRRTNSKLKALDETKDDFISMASHQLRTPLTSVKGYLSMVLEGDAGKITPVQRKMLDQAFVSSQRMVFLIADLLNVSRLKTGKFVIEPSPVNLAKTVDDEIKQLQETAKNRELELLYDKPEEFPTLMIDETKIRQVIMNFVDNAIYYTPKGGRIVVELTDTPDTVELRVKDNGIGVPRREQPHLFTKFYRAGNARQARPDGTGLGLFMAKKVVVAQGGAVIFDSEEGKGSTFGFIFPKAKLVAPPALQAQALHR